MTPTLLLTATLRLEELADLDPPLAVEVEELDELDTLIERPEVGGCGLALFHGGRWLLLFIRRDVLYCWLDSSAQQST